VSVDWDPFDVAVDIDPYPVWRRLRDEQPLYRNEKYDFWALSRYDDVALAHRDAVTFSSAHGTVLEIMQPEPIPGGASSFMDPAHTRHSARPCLPGLHAPARRRLGAADS
jgi:cytochrome P450